MDNPLLAKVREKYPGVDPAALQWPEGAGSWSEKDLDLFVGSGGQLKPKKPKSQQPPEPSHAATAPSAPPVPNLAAAAVATAKPAEEERQRGQSHQLGGAEASSFENPAFDSKRHVLTMPVRIHCEDTQPSGHVRLESLLAFSERLRSLALQNVMGVSLSDLKEKKLAILATEFVVEVVASSKVRALDTLRVDSSVEFPGAPLFPWGIEMYLGEALYSKGRVGLNLCATSDSGTYSGVGQQPYDDFTQVLKQFTNPTSRVFSRDRLRMYYAYEPAGQPFAPSQHREASYTVRAADCDLYNVLFQARVPSMMESCHTRYGATAMYVNIRTSVRPGDTLNVHILSAAEDEVALFLCLRGREAVLLCLGHYGSFRPISQEEVRCGSVFVPALLKYCLEGVKPTPNKDLDLSQL